MKELIIGEGTEYERRIILPKPRGRRAREMMPKLTSFMKSVTASEGADDTDILETIQRFWDQSEFEDVLVPYVLGLEDPEGREYLNEECTTVDILNAFMEAATHIIMSSSNRPEVVEALKKSNEESQENPSSEMEK